jgi:hypothetical protein
MNNRILALTGALSLTALFAPLQNLGAAVAYTNSLTNLSLVSSNFTSYTTVDSDYINKPSGGWFVVDTNYGLELLSTNPNYVEGLVTYNRLLQASNDWTITIQSHISAFTNTQTNPYYSAGLSLIRTTTNGLEYPNRVDLNLVRSGLTGAVLSNSIVSSLFINNGETDTATNKNLTNVYLQFRYTATNKTVASAYSTNGSNFTTIQSYNLTTNWNIKATDQLTLGVTANNQPDARVTPSYNVLPGFIYLKSLIVVSTNAPTNAPQNTYSGDTLSLGAGASNNSFVGGGTLGGTVNLGGNGNGGISFGSGSLTLGGSNSYSGGNNTNVLVFGGGSLTLGGNGSLTIGGGSTNTNGFQLGTGTLTIGGSNSYSGGTINTGAISNTIPGGTGSLTIPSYIIVTSLTNIPSFLYSSNGAVVNVLGVGFYTNVNGVFKH